MRIWEVLDSSMDEWKADFVRLTAVPALIILPVWLPHALCHLLPEPIISPEWNWYERLAFSIPGLLMWFVLRQIWLGALTARMSACMMNEEMNLWSAYSPVLRRIAQFLTAGALLFLLCGAGFLLLVVPGIILFVWFALVPQVLVVEGLPAVAALRRSRRLISGHFWRTLAVLLLAWLRGVIVGFLIVALPGALVVALVRELSSVAGDVVQEILDACIHTLCAASVGVALAVLYRDTRKEEEGDDAVGRDLRDTAARARSDADVPVT